MNQSVHNKPAIFIYFLILFASIKLTTSCNSDMPFVRFVILGKYTIFSKDAFSAAGFIFQKVNPPPPHPSPKKKKKKSPLKVRVVWGRWYARLR